MSADITGTAPVQAAVEAAVEQVPAQAAPPAVDPNKAFEMKERQLHKMRQAIKAEKAAMERERAEWQAKLANYETGYIPKQRLIDDPYGTLQSEAGYDYNKLTELLLQTPQDPATRTLMNKVQELTNKIGAAERQQAEAAQTQRKQAESQIRADVKQFIAADDRFESVKARNMDEAVSELIIQTYDRKGMLMDYAEAAQQVENYLIEEGVAFAQLKPVQARLAPKPVEATAAPKKQTQVPYTTTTKTLTNAVQATSTPGRKSERERMERAKAAFYGQKLG